MLSLDQIYEQKSFCQSPAIFSNGFDFCCMLICSRKCAQHVVVDYHDGYQNEKIS
jgi:hypothetical protein